MKIDEKMDWGFYITGWCLMAVVGAYLLFTGITGIHLLRYLPGCAIHELTGLYCPGCGGTRAVIALLHGKFILSAVYHPLVLYTAVLGGWFMVSQTIQHLSGNRLRIGMHFRSIYLWLALILIVANVILKNALLLELGIQLPG